MSQLLPEYRTILGWEANVPTPPPKPTLEARLTDARLQWAQEAVDALFDLDPELRDLHYEPADLPAECVRIMAQTGITGLWPAIAPCPEYIEYLFSTNADAAYEYLDKALKTLQPEAKWLLKAPMHSLYPESILEVWPDATFIRIDRNLDAACKSAIKFFSRLRNLSRPDMMREHELEVASWIRPYLSEHNRRLDNLDAPVVTIAWEDLWRDSILTVGKVCDAIHL